MITLIAVALPGHATWNVDVNNCCLACLYSLLCYITKYLLWVLHIYFTWEITIQNAQKEDILTLSDARMVRHQNSDLLQLYFILYFISVAG